MNTDYQIPEPFLFNPIKHHLGFIKEFINLNIDKSMDDIQSLARDLKHLGTSVMDIYTGSLTIKNIIQEAEEFLKQKDFFHREAYMQWVGTKIECFRIIPLSDGSLWTLKFHDDQKRFVHVFPARYGIDGSRAFNNFRVKANTLKSALLYNIIIGKDLVTGEDLNKVRPLLSLSPVKDPSDAEAIVELIEILRE